MNNCDTFNYTFLKLFNDFAGKPLFRFWEIKKFNERSFDKYLGISMYRKFRPNCYNFVMEGICSTVTGHIISTIHYKFHAYKFVLKVCRYISAITLTKACSIDDQWALTSFCDISNTPEKLGNLYPYYPFLQLKKFKYIIKLCNTYWINVCPVFISFTQYPQSCGMFLVFW